MRKEVSWYEIGKTFLKMLGNILYNSCFIWVAVNLFLVAFSFPLHLTFLQAISTVFLYVVLKVVFGGNSK